MNELTRMAYLRAMGTDLYVSRGPLAGAAPTRRLAIRATPSVTNSAPAMPAPAARRRQSLSAGLSAAPLPDLGKPAARAGSAGSAPVAPESRPTAGEPALRFSLMAVSCGGWLWLEELKQTPGSPEQVQLIQAMAVALGAQPASSGVDSPGGKPPQVTRFDWPIHANRQLDQGEEAARHGVTGFIQRKLDEEGHVGLVLLGKGSEARILPDELQCPRIGRTAATAEILRDPLLKKQVWRDLRPLFQSG